MTRFASEARSTYASDTVRAPSASVRRPDASRADGPFDSLVDYSGSSDAATAQAAPPAKHQSSATADTGTATASSDRAQSTANDKNGAGAKNPADKTADEPSEQDTAHGHQKTSDTSSDDAKSATAARKDKAGKSDADAAKSADASNAVTADPNAAIAASSVAAAAAIAITQPPVAAAASITQPPVAAHASSTAVAGIGQANSTPPINLTAQQAAANGANPDSVEQAAKADRKDGKVSIKTAGDTAASQSGSDRDESDDVSIIGAAPVKGPRASSVAPDHRAKQAQEAAKETAQAPAQDDAPDASAPQNNGSTADPTSGQPDASDKTKAPEAKPQETQAAGPNGAPSAHHTTGKSDSDSASAKDSSATPPNGGDPTAQGLTANVGGAHTTASDQAAAPQDKSTPAAAAASLTVPVQGVAVAITAQAQAGNSYFAIRLDPPELGKIEVHLNMHNDGHVTSHLVVDHPETLDLLKRDAPALQRTLQDAGFKTSGNGLQFSLRDQGNSNQNQYQPDRSARPIAPQIVTSNTIPTPIVSRQRLMASLRGGLDIQV